MVMVHSKMRSNARAHGGAAADGREDAQGVVPGRQRYVSLAEQHAKETRAVAKIFDTISYGVSFNSFDPDESWSLPVDMHGDWTFGSSRCRAKLEDTILKLIQCDESSNNGLISARWPTILTAAFPEMDGWPLQRMLVGICLRAWKNRKEGRGADLKCVEYFAGSGQLTKEFLRAGKKSVALDRLYSRDHDVSHGPGVRLWLDAMCCTAPSALTWFGTQCSSFVLLCHTQAQRLPSNGFWGDTGRDFIQEGNHVMDVTAMLFFISFLLLNVPVLEQPWNSVLPKVSSLALVLRLTQAQQVKTYGAAFGTDSLKPWQLWSSAQAVESLARSRPNVASEALVTHDYSSGQFTGIKDALKASEWYPANFGKAVVDMMDLHSRSLQPGVVP